MGSPTRVSMQNSFRCRKIIWLSLLPLLGSGFPAEGEGVSPPAGGGLPLSQFRVIAAQGAQKDVFHAGLEITLQPTALTYWRQPGDAGVPPSFSFEGSENLASARVLYPAPKRIREDEGEAFGYQDKVVFPVLITPKNIARPVALKVIADYAVCERICMPVRVKAEINLPVPEPAAQDKALGEAEAKVPQALALEDLNGKLKISPVAGAKQPSWQLKWNGPTPMTDLFAEAGAGWYFETKKTAENEFSIVAVDVPNDENTSGKATTTSVALTITGFPRSYTFTVPLDASGLPHP